MTLTARVCSLQEPQLRARLSIIDQETLLQGKTGPNVTTEPNQERLPPELLFSNGPIPSPALVLACIACLRVSTLARNILRSLALTT
jgi:hypothetical protein